MSITSTFNPKITDQNGTILTDDFATINSYTNGYYLDLGFVGINNLFISSCTIDIFLYSSNGSPNLVLINGDETISKISSNQVSNNIYQLTYDLTNYLDTFPSLNYLSFSLFNQDNFSISIYTHNYSTPTYRPCLTIIHELTNYYPKSDAINTFKIGNYVEYDFNYGLGTGLIKKRLFEHLLPYSVYLVFNPLTGAFKLNLIETLDVSTMVLTDSSFNEIHFAKAINSNSVYFDTSGSGLIIEKVSNNYYLKSPLSSNAYKEFNSSGKLINIVDEYQKNITISYITTGVSITDYNGKVLSMTAPTIGALRYYSTIKYDNVSFYRVRNQGTGANKILQFYEYFGSTSTLKFAFSLNAIGTIICIHSSDHHLALTYTNNRVSEIHSYVDKGTEKTIEDLTYTYNQNGNVFYTEETNFKGISYRYIFDYDYRLISKSEILDDEEVEWSFYNLIVDNVSLKNLKLNKLVPYYPNIIRNVTYSNNEEFNENLFDIHTLTKESLANDDEFCFKKYKKYLIKADLNCSTSYDFSEDHYVKLLLRLRPDVSYVTLKPIFSSSGTKRYLYYIFEVGNYEIERVDINICYRGVSGTFTLEDVIFFELSSYELLTCKATNESTFYDFDSQSYFEYEEFYGSKPTRINNVIFTKTDCLLNETLALKSINYFFYNDLKGLVVNPYSVIYFIKTTGDPTHSVNKNNLRFKTVIKNNTNSLETIKYNEYISNELIKHKNFSYNSVTTNTSEKLDSCFAVISKIDEFGIITNTSYNSRGDITQIQTGITNHFDTTCYDYESESPYRLESLEYNVGSSQNTLEYTHYSDFSLIETITNSLDQSESYLYINNSTTLNKQSELKLQDLNNHIFSNIFTYNDEFLANIKVADDDPTFYFEYDDYNELASIRLNDEESEPLLTIERNITDDGDSITYGYSNGYHYTEHFDLYGRLESIYVSTIPYVLYTYLVRKIDDDGEPYYDVNDHSSNAFLRIAIDYYASQSYLYDYDASGKLTKTKLYRDVYHQGQSNTLLATYQNIYDDLNRLVKRCIQTTSNFAFPIDYYEEDSFYRHTNDVRTRMISQRVNGNSNYFTDSIEKDSLNRVSSYTITLSGNDLETDYSYHNNTQYVFQRFVWAGLDTNVILSESLSYDTNGNISSITNTTSSTIIFSFQYDLNNRIIQEGRGTHQGILTEYTNYTYDKNGNITQIKHHYPFVFQSDDYEYFTYDDGVYADRLKGYRLNNGTQIAITYDNNDEGLNPVIIGDKYLSWTRGRLLSEYKLGTGNAAKYVFTYNKDGIRIKKERQEYSSSYQTIVTHEYLLDGKKIIGEKITDNSNNTIHLLRYYHGLSGIEGFMYDTTLYLYLKDPLNNIVALLDSSLTIVARYSYDAYGNTKVLNADGSTNASSTFIGNINPFRYKGYYYDSELEMYYCNSRYYYPLFRRWLNADDLKYLDKDKIDGLNLYAYCKNNPVMNADPDGTIALSLLFIGLGIGAALGATSSVVSQGLTKGWDKIDGLQVLLDTLVGAVDGLVSFSGVGIVGSAVCGWTLGFIGSIGGDLISNQGKWNNSFLEKAFFMAGANFVLGLMGGGAQSIKLEKLEPTATFGTVISTYFDILMKKVSDSSQFLVSSYLSFTFFDVLAFYTKLWE